jgi:3-oxoacyl-[acyl-carrier protein] reductase
VGKRPGAAGYVLDVTSAEQIAEVRARLAAEHGPLDILVNNAGIASAAAVWELTPEEWDRVLNVNLRVVFFASQAAARAMRAADSGGAIVNVASIAGQNGGMAGSAAYAAAKAGVIGLTRSLARQLAADRIRVNCLAPADIETDMTAGWPHALRERLVAMTPLGRFGGAEEVAGAAVFLASDEASFVTGQTLAVNGGAHMG